MHNVPTTVQMFMLANEIEEVEALVLACLQASQQTCEYNELLEQLLRASEICVPRKIITAKNQEDEEHFKEKKRGEIVKKQGNARLMMMKDLEDQEVP